MHAGGVVTLLPTLTAIENVQLPMFETPRTAKQRVARAAELLEIVGLSHRSDHLPTQLSVGERQRVAIARSLANEPQALLADEPTGNLDSKTGAQIMKLLHRYNTDHNQTIVMVTHDTALAVETDRYIMLRDGQLVSRQEGKG